MDLRYILIAAVAFALAGCSGDGAGNIRPLEQPVVVVDARVPVRQMADCLYRQLDARYSPNIHRTRPAAGDDEIIYSGTSGIRTWEVTISPAPGGSSRVAFRSMNTIRGHDVFWQNIAPQRAACGV